MMTTTLNTLAYISSLVILFPLFVFELYYASLGTFIQFHSSLQDLDILHRINWEVIIVDECQRPIICSHLEKMKMLKGNMWLLVLSDQLKVCFREWFMILTHNFIYVGIFTICKYLCVNISGQYLVFIVIYLLF